MLNLTFLPPRQKIYIGITIFFGLLIILCSVGNWMEPDRLNLFIFAYSMCVPLFLLASDTLIDLNDNRIFIIWLAIAVVMVVIGLAVYKNDKFIIHRDVSVSGIMVERSVDSLKALLAFLIVYWPINKLLNKQGVYVINTFRQSKWYHKAADREISWGDVLINFLLMAVIFAGVLVKGYWV